jgi:hypothetical protein
LGTAATGNAKKYSGKIAAASGKAIQQPGG